jgi:hypothetical protein
MLWLSGLWQVLGAGAATLSSLTFVLVADSCPAEQRYSVVLANMYLILPANRQQQNYSILTD